MNVNYQIKQTLEKYIYLVKRINEESRPDQNPLTYTSYENNTQPEPEIYTNFYTSVHKYIQFINK